jgi:hypothetical protein
MIVSLVADNKKEQIYTALKDFCLNSIGDYLKIYRDWHKSLEHLDKILPE